MKISLAYFGTPYFSARFLEKLVSHSSINRLIEVKLVVTQPDKPVGRKQIITPSPVKEAARKYQISNIKYQKDIRNWKLEVKNFDLALVFAFGQIIPEELLSLPKYGFLNIHPSLLPKYRGPSPIAYPLILGDKKTGVTIIKMDEKIDHGPIIAQEELEILPTDRRPDLEIKLTDLAFEMFKNLIFQLTSWSVNKLTLTPQLCKNATYTRFLKKSDGFVPLIIFKKALQGNNNNLKKNNKESFLPTIVKEYYQKNPNIPITNYQLPITLFNLFRGLYPWPGIWTILPNGKRLKINEMELLSNDQLIIKKVQLEGKKQVSFHQFNQAYKIF